MKYAGCFQNIILPTDICAMTFHNIQFLSGCCKDKKQTQKLRQLEKVLVVSNNTVF